MKRLSVKLFFSSVAILLVIVLFLLLFFNYAFPTLYVASQLQPLQRELEKTVLACNEPSQLTSELTHFTQNTGSPVLVLGEDGRMLESGLSAYLRTVSVKDGEGQTFTVPVGYLYRVFRGNAPALPHGARIDLELLPLSEAGLCLPLDITVEGVSFKDKRTRERLGEGDAVLLSDALILGSANLNRDLNQTSFLAELLLDNAAEAFVLETDGEDFFDTLCSSTVSVDGGSYRFLCVEHRCGGENCRFLTVGSIIVTGHEKSFFGRALLIVAVVLAVLLILGSLRLSGMLSRPLTELSEAASRLAAMDFSQRIETDRNDELGVLAGNINLLADNLQQVLEELQQSNAGLVQSSRAARENEARMQKLLADLAHEFKTPLGIISSYVEALQLGLCETPEKYYEIIDGEIDSLTYMVNETIELTRLQTGQWKVEIGNYSLYDILEDVYHRFSDKLEAAGYRFTVENRDLIAACDAHRIRQVISNFISNATKYSDERREIRVYTTCGEGSVTVHVENSGQLECDDPALIWERSYGEMSVSHEFLPSQGIGLDIVRRILDAHGSSYSVRSADGRVTFSFTLPVVGE